MLPDVILGTYYGSDNVWNSGVTSGTGWQVAEPVNGTSFFWGGTRRTSIAN